MDSKNLIIGGLVLGAAYMYMNSSKEKYYTINGQSVPESRLPSMGYVFLNGQWWPPSAVQAAAQQGGAGIPNVAPGTNAAGDQTWAIIAQILNTGMQFIPLLTSGNNNTGTGTGSGTNTGGGLG